MLTSISIAAFSWGSGLQFRNRGNSQIAVVGMGFHLNVQAMPKSDSVSVHSAHSCMSQIILHPFTPLSVAVRGDALPAAAVFSEDVKDFASQI